MDRPHLSVGPQGWLPPVIRAQAWQLKAYDPQIWDQNLEILHEYMQHHLLDKAHLLAEAAKSLPLLHTTKQALDNLDKQCAQGMDHAKYHCWKLHIWPYGWTLLKVSHMNLHIKDWQYSLRPLKQQPYQAQLLQRMATALKLMYTSKNITGDKNPQKFHQPELLLKKAWGKPKHWEKWLEG